ncbi:MAG: Phosphoglycerate kinase [Alphaproteobacteria bacterium MarineAlpha5_Bin8]|nr:MAG: Phosphoglycerate kinase [Alphaproteobacteria bacterium MarineAlpha5_Bin7]PPR46303.1 MAG: Phosphoglycerate kinase [Alphaproteobacteria bacterium MarineAlpha5_Bin8]PPR54888.1 MAG: Phosphoglycerate kinase [Alphaproteobacteria bacterium MarineAlpha5_Bin6]|tara:strand:- start:5471 stop:6670 length:1200 start_codon:yes stop_codon:yes gene_type:complete
MKTINNYSLKNKNVLIRVDLNVPVIDGVVTDQSRIASIKSTINKVIQGNNKIFLLSHFGRPKGKYNKKYSLEFICDVLKTKLKVNKIYFINSLEAKDIQKIQKNMKHNDICLFENIRFYNEEEKNDLNFSKNLSKCFDVFINEAFSASHRKHSSIVGITKFLPSIAGDNLIDEIKNLNFFLDTSAEIKTAVIGGSKISTKIELIDNLIKYFDNISIAGAMANTFLLAKGYRIGNSIVERNHIDTANNILSKAKKHNCNVFLPVDVVCANNINDKVNINHCDIANVLSDQMILDIGDKTTKNIINVLVNSNMVLWNGPLGAFEHKPFDHGTIEVLNVIKNNNIFSDILTLAGGGDTISAIKMANAERSFSYISNAGGAFLEWLEGKESPGVKALRENNLF